METTNTVGIKKSKSLNFKLSNQILNTLEGAILNLRYSFKNVWESVKKEWSDLKLDSPKEFKNRKMTLMYV